MVQAESAMTATIANAGANARSDKQGIVILLCLIKKRFFFSDEGIGWTEGDIIEIG